MGANFEHKDVKDGEFVELRPLFREKPRKSREVSEVDKEIQKVIRMKTPKKVKPGYKKKLQWEVDKVKRREKRRLIRREIHKQIKEKAIAKLKEEQE